MYILRKMYVHLVGTSVLEYHTESLAYLANVLCHFLSADLSHT
jgi:hypothetical protein